MITERIMKPGSFRVELVEDAPFSAREASELFDHVVITPTKMEPIAAFSDANILANAIYTGTITAKPSGRILEGSGLVSWLGTSEGLGDLLTANVDFTAATLTTVVNTLRPASLAAGTVTNTSAHSGSYWMVTPREALDAICSAVSAEYIVQPDFTLDAGPTSALFVTTPTVVVTRKPEGRDGSYTGLNGGLIVTSTDVTQFTTQGIGAAGGEGDGLVTITGTNYGAGGYKDGLNNAVVMQRLVNVPEINDTTAALAITNAVAAAWNDPRYGLEVTTTSPVPRQYAKPGDFIYVHDLYEQLQDAANQIAFRGETIAPIKLRCTAMTWPVERGMGVYVRRSGATPIYTDLTSWVQWEQAETRWEVALTAPVSTVHTDPVKAGKVGYLGANAEVSQRAAQKPRVGASASRVSTFQSIPNNAITAISFDTEFYDSAGFITVPVTTMTIPANYDGVYAITARATWAAVGVTEWISISIGGARVQAVASSGGDTFAAASITVPLVAGNTVGILVYQASGAAMNITAGLDITRVG